jgi:hypothetical protein
MHIEVCFNFFIFLGNIKRWLNFVVNDHQLLHIKTLKLK